MKKLTWKKTVTEEFKYKDIECKEIDLSISYDEIRKGQLGYDIIYNKGLSCILWYNRHTIEGE